MKPLFEINVPHSICEIEGAEDCAIEFRSFSKNAVHWSKMRLCSNTQKSWLQFKKRGSKIMAFVEWRQSTKFME